MMYAVLRGLMRAITRLYLVGLFEVQGTDNVPPRGTFDRLP